MKAYAGIDLHSSNNYIGIIDEQDRRLYGKRMSNDLNHVLMALAPFRDQLEAVVVESTYNLKEINATVTYHDPCDLVRNSGIFESPREVLKAIPGISLIEIPNNRQMANCCGRGGNLEMVDPGLFARVAQMKIDEILETGQTWW